MTTPKVTIGMPVFNGEKTVKRAIDSLVTQSHKNIEFIISDNASTDATKTICEQYATNDARIRYIRQKQNIGPGKNFNYVLKQATGEYFMWAAHDDAWDQDFIKINLENLMCHANAIASISNVLLNGHRYNQSHAGTQELIGSFKSKISDFLRMPGANSRFYSLFRAHVICKIADNDYDYLGGDWSMIIDLLDYGDFLTIKDYYGFEKSLSGLGSSPARYSQARRMAIEWLLPYARVSMHALKKSHTPLAIFYLLRLNATANKERMLARHE